MSKVNRNPQKVKRYTQETKDVSLEKMVKFLSGLKMQLDNFELDGAEDQNLKDHIRSVKEHIEKCLSSVKQLEAVNERLGQECGRLMDIAENTDFMTIDTDPVETALNEALLSVDNFYNFASQHADSVAMGIRERIIQGALVEFRAKVTERLIVLRQQKRRLIEETREEDEQVNSQQLARLDAQIDHMNRCLAAAETYEKRLNQCCLTFEQIKTEAYSFTSQIRKVHSLASEKSKAIKQAVNNQ